MSLIVAGVFRVPPESLPAFQPHMEAMVAASRAEDGCLDYAYALDVIEPGLVRVFEVWRDQVALDRHAASEHLAKWRAAWPAFGAGDRRLFVYEAGPAVAL